MLDISALPIVTFPLHLYDLSDLIDMFLSLVYREEHGRYGICFTSVTLCCTFFVYLMLSAWKSC